MDLNQWRIDPHSRRKFFAMSGVTMGAGGAVFLGACGADDETTSSTTSASGDGDVDILNSALELELTAIAAYTAGAELLKGPVLDAGKVFLSQEQEHADAITTAIEDLGGTPVEAKDPEEYGFPKLKDQTDVLNFANEIENTAIAAYIDAIPKISNSDLRVTAAQIVTNEAEHVAVLLGALGEDQVPEAFVTGTPA